MLQLSLCVLTVIQMTSAQSTYDVTQQENDVTSCECTEHVLSDLMTLAYQLQTAVLPLQREVAEIKAAIAHRNARGMWVSQARGLIIIPCKIILS